MTIAVLVLPRAATGSEFQTRDDESVDVWSSRCDGDGNCIRQSHDQRQFSSNFGLEPSEEIKFEWLLGHDLFDSVRYSTDGLYAYAADWFRDTLYVFRVESSTGKLTFFQNVTVPLMLFDGLQLAKLADLQSYYERSVSGIRSATPQDPQDGLFVGERLDPDLALFLPSSLSDALPAIFQSEIKSRPSLLPDTLLDFAKLILPKHFPELSGIVFCNVVHCHLLVTLMFVRSCARADSTNSRQGVRFVCHCNQRDEPHL